jgi:hypothetical protein
MRSFSALDQRRRRCTDVITSTALVIVLVLVIVLALAANPHVRKAALTGRIRLSSAEAQRTGARNRRDFSLPMELVRAGIRWISHR